MKLFWLLVLLILSVVQGKRRQLCFTMEGGLVEEPTPRRGPCFFADNDAEVQLLKRFFPCPESMRNNSDAIIADINLAASRKELCISDDGTVDIAQGMCMSSSLRCWNFGCGSDCSSAKCLCTAQRRTQKSGCHSFSATELISLAHFVTHDK